MSRSYKYTPRAGDKKDKFFKKYSNRRLRKLPLEETYSHKTYKKANQSWNICDYESVGITFEEFWKERVGFWYRWRYQYEPFPDKKQAYKDYCRWFLRK